MSTRSKKGASAALKRRQKALRRARSQDHHGVDVSVFAGLQKQLEEARERLHRANLLLVSIVMDHGGKMYVPEPAWSGRWRLDVYDQSTTNGVILVLVEGDEIPRA